MASGSRPGQPQVAALIGVLAELEGAVRTGRLPLDVGRRLRRRLVDARLLPVTQPYEGLADGLGALGQDLRRLEDPGPHPDGDRLDLPVENLVAFGDEPAAVSFVEEMRARGRDVDPPVHEEELRRWTVVLRSEAGAEDPFAGVGPDAARAIDRGGWHLGAS